MDGLLAAGMDDYRIAAPCRPHVPSQPHRPTPVYCSEAGCATPGIRRVSIEKTVVKPPIHL